MGKNAVSYSGVKSIVDDGYEDVYCLSVPETGNFVANGIVVKNCDALRYAVYSSFPQGNFGTPDEFLSIDQIRRNIYGDDQPLLAEMGHSGYF